MKLKHVIIGAVCVLLVVALCVPLTASADTSFSEKLTTWLDSVGLFRKEVTTAEPIETGDEDGDGFACVYSHDSANFKMGYMPNPTLGKVSYVAGFQELAPNTTYYVRWFCDTSIFENDYLNPAVDDDGEYVMRYRFSAEADELGTIFNYVNTTDLEEFYTVMEDTTTFFTTDENDQFWFSFWESTNELESETLVTLRELVRENVQVYLYLRTENGTTEVAA